jgi:hypothetical protein
LAAVVRRHALSGQIVHRVLYASVSGAKRPQRRSSRSCVRYLMVWPDREINPTTDPAAPAVLEAFDAAQEAHLLPVTCYRAGVEAWRRAHPDQRPEYAAKQAVAVILAAKVRLRVDDA